MPDNPKSESAKAGESTPANWWQTMPGMLTAIAGIITAIAGLVAALHQAGLLSIPQESVDVSVAIDSPIERADETPIAPQSDNASPKILNPQSSNENTKAVELAAGMEAKLLRPDGEVVYKILSARLEPFNAENNALKLTVRCSSNTQYAINFWSASFRLLVDGVLRSPTNDLNEVVDPQSAKEGEVVFTVPIATRNTILKIGDPGKETTEIPLDLNAGKPSQP